ncbi:RNA-binding E3 ubiquitin-protein ligase MEX3C [Pseudopipra pipra]|uniref:RNA-binding E3 ubiquitin-protein ligase MEX3C n=1 Tax=Pseudopipra pipra TaxID=415032 RepID=UPI00313A3BEA
MPSGAAAAEPAETPPPPPLPPLRLPPRAPLVLLRQRLAGLGLRHGEREGEEGEPELQEELMAGEDEEEEEEDEDEDDDDEDDEEEEEEEEGDAAALLLLPPPCPPALPPVPGLCPALLPGLGAARSGARGAVAAALPAGCPGAGSEPAALLRRRSVNTTECVPVPSSEHVAEIVGRQGCKIKALRAKTNTYIKTPIRGEDPVFVVTGRKEDVAMAKREILSAAEHFSLIRASRGKGPAPGCAPALPGQTTVQVRVPYRVVGLVVGPRGATIKRIQQQTHTYIVTPSRDKEPVFEVTGMPENVDRAREEIEMHIAVRTGSFVELLSEENDFHCNGTDVGFEGGAAAWAGPTPAPACARAASGYRNDSSSSLGSGSTDSYFGSGRLADFSPTSPFGAGGFWFGEALPSAGAEDSVSLDSPAFEPLPAPAIWAPFEPVSPLPGRGPARAPRHGSQPCSPPRLSPTAPEEHPPARGLPVLTPPFSNGTNSCSSSNGSASSSPPEGQQRRHDCVLCLQGEVVAALVPCGHNLFCLDCAHRLCERRAPACPVCQAAVTQAIQIHS